MIARVLAPGLVVVLVLVPATPRAQGVIWVHDGMNLPEHRLRGKVRAENDLKAGASKFYVPVCTFFTADKKQIRRDEIRRALYKASNIIVMANLCNDLIPNASQQEAFVTGYNAVMNPAIGKRLGRDWQAEFEKQVSIELRKHPHGTLRSDDIEFETPY